MDEPKFKNVPMVALSRAFYKGRLIGPGEKAGDKFVFTGDKLPKFAVVDKGQVIEQPKAKPLNGDTKPKDAQEAVKAKAAGAQG